MTYSSFAPDIIQRRLLIIALALIGAGNALAANYEVAFSTYLGGSNWEHARDVCVDAEGNCYIVGGTKSVDFPTTEGAFQRKQDQTGKRIGSGGCCDAFVSKFDAEGRLLWSTLLGGPNYDRGYGIEVDGEGFVYVCGRSGPGFPVTDGAFQTQFRGTSNGIYGMQNGFVAKLKPDGSGLVWAAYVGVGQLCRDLSIDAQGDVYLALHYTGRGPLPPDTWFQSAYQKKPAGLTEIGALKVAADGSEVLWATWLGGSGKEAPNCGIRVDGEKNVYLNFTTQSTDVPTTQGAHDRSYNGGGDAFVAKLAPDGSKLLFGTYFGGRKNEFGNSTHNLALDAAGNAYLVCSSDGNDIPVTDGAFQSRRHPGDRDIVAAKFASQTGALLRCTYFGGSGPDGIDGVYVNAKGDVCFTGLTGSLDFPVTPGALQKRKAAKHDAILVVLAADFASLKYATYLGGPSYDYGRSFCLDAAGNLYLTGSSNGPGWPLHNSHQPRFAGGGGGKELCYQGGCYAGDIILAKIAPRQ